jgi:hypothetical protein
LLPMMTLTRGLTWDRSSVLILDLWKKRGLAGAVPGV